jgi:lon-related putative ATP-dependent protease
MLFTRTARRRLKSCRVKPSELRWNCDPSILGFRTTAELRPGMNVIDQKKAVKALSLGIHLRSPGYNLFVCGLTGTGRSNAIRHVLDRNHRAGYRPVDLCYVPNFEAPECPSLLAFPAGEGARFRREVHGLLGRAMRIHQETEGAERRRALRALLAEAIPFLARTFPDDRARSYLESLERVLLDREGKCQLDEVGVNLIAQPRGKTSPVVIPGVVSYGTLFGVVDHGRGTGTPRPPAAIFSGIRPGAVVEASGGVLVLSASALLSAKGCWSALKSVLEHGRLEVHDLVSSTGDLKSALRPDPIPIDLKVILIGDFGTYDYLLSQDPDFGDLFKIRVDFDSERDLTRSVIAREYPAFIARIIRDEGLRHFSAPAVARVIEYGVRRAGRKNKITTQSSAIADLVREASFWAVRSGRQVVGASDVEQALREGLDRLNLVETKISEMIVDGTILIDTRGTRIGQVNGLAVYDQGDYVFGKPSRITAETSVGQGGIINIERESGFSGKSHDKGVQILGGYLRSRFAQHRPMSLTASVCFEQSYSGVDGDSASSSEIYALLSSLSGLPVRQDLAVTGSMNQKGDIQPIGGVNEKVEGFFDCVASGKATGREGVIIPRRNIPDLMLREDVVRAVKKGRFHIYAIDTVEEGIEILTGVPAGRARKRGGYSPGSVFDRADRRLEEIASGLRDGAE